MSNLDSQYLNTTKLKLANIIAPFQAVYIDDKTNYINILEPNLKKINSFLSSPVEAKSFRVLAPPSFFNSSQLYRSNVFEFGAENFAVDFKFSTSIRVVKFGDVQGRNLNDLADILAKVTYNCKAIEVQNVDFKLTMSLISTNYCIATPLISNVRFTKLEHHKLLLINLFSEVKEPSVNDVFSVLTMENRIPKIQNIDFKISCPKILGKNYVKSRKSPNEQQKELFTNIVAIEAEENKKPRIERQYPKHNQESVFDIFDLIFPALQPPLGNSFDNPISFPYELYPFQVDGVQFLYSSTTALLGDEMGLGKSIQAITATRLLFREGKIVTVFIVCPKSVLTDWENKFWEWAPELKVIKVSGNQNIRTILWSTDSHVYISTYETLKNDIDNNIAKIKYDVVIFDETQKIKNPSIGLTKAARTVSSKYKWALTGTPLENKVEDLVSICETIKPKMFDNVCIGDIAKVIETYKPIFKRRKKDDVLKELPPKSTKEVWLDLLPTQRKKYDLAEQQGIVDLKEKGETATLQHVLALITKLKQICNYEITTDESAKLEYLKEELEELTEQGDKALVFSQYPNETLKRILPHLKEYSPNIYDGSLSDLKRTTIVNEFQTTDNSKVMLLSLKAGNAGITLTRANYVYHFDLWWNPAVSAQAVDRTHRIGQTKTVFERLLLAEDTIERRIYNILADKRRLFNEVVDGLSDANLLSQTMTEDEIFGLFGLKKNRPQTRQRIKNKSKDFHSLDPFAFEQFIGELFSQMGYNSRVTKKSNDGGVDIIAKRQTPTGIDEVIIQCKHKENPSSTVDVAKVRELFGVFSAKKKFTKAILVTNGRFTRGAEDFGINNGIELIDGKRIEFLIDEYNIVIL